MLNEVKYPFVPKSNRSLIPGQFWAIPLNNGKFACGRVIEVHPFETKMFLAGLVIGLEKWFQKKTIWLENKL